MPTVTTFDTKRFQTIVTTAVIFILMLSSSVSFGIEKRKKVVAIHKGSQLLFWDIMESGAKKAAAEYDLDLEWAGAEYSDNTQSQIKLLNYYVDQGVDAIFLVPTNQDALIAPVKRAKLRGTKVVIVDSSLRDSYHETFIGTDNFGGGKQAAKELAGLIAQEGNVALIRTVQGSASTDRRGDGFLSAIKANYPKMKVVADVYAGAIAGSAFRVAKRVLSTNPNLAGIFCVNESSTEGTLKAFREAGVLQKIKFIGFDSNEFLLEGVRRKEIDILLIQNPRKMGYLGVSALAAALKGQKHKETQFLELISVSDKNLSDPEISKLLRP